ncbi:MAG: hypothetical protein ABSG68_25650, partial [Thermoguttaceae bacterium]
ARQSVNRAAACRGYGKNERLRKYESDLRAWIGKDISVVWVFWISPMMNQTPIATDVRILTGLWPSKWRRERS